MLDIAKARFSTFASQIVLMAHGLPLIVTITMTKFLRLALNLCPTIASKGHIMKSTRSEYLNFFNNWLHYQFPRNADMVRNVVIMREVKNIIDSDQEAAYWGDRDCWTMYDIASKQVQSRAIEGITA